MKKNNNFISFAKYEPPAAPWFLGVGPVIVMGKEIGYCDGNTIKFYKKGTLKNPVTGKRK